jgi:hypothetical protein
VHPLTKNDYYGFSEATTNTRDLTFKISRVPYKRPLALESHGRAMEAFFKKTDRLNWKPELGEYENNRTARVKEINWETGEIVLEEATYFDQVATNIGVDTDSYKLSGKSSIRRGIEAPIEGKLPNLNKSQLANTIGVAAMAFDHSGRAMFRYRNPKMASISKKALHCTVSGVFELPEWSERGQEYDFSLIETGMHLEIDNELKLEPHEYDLFPVAFGRELPRAGKPQFFFMIRPKVNLQVMEERAKTAIEHAEFTMNTLSEFHDRETNAKTYEYFTYEGWAAYIFAKRFRTANHMD